jgi:hypothetical protein
MGCLYSKLFVPKEEVNVVPKEEVNVVPKLRIKIPQDISEKKKRLICDYKRTSYSNNHGGV